MLTARRNLLKTVLALVTLPIAKLASTNSHQFNRSHAHSMALIDEKVKRIADVIDKGFTSLRNTFTDKSPYEYRSDPESIILTKCGDGSADIAYVWPTPYEGRTIPRSIETMLPYASWEIYLSVARELGVRNRTRHLTIANQINGVTVPVSTSHFYV